MVKNTTNWLFLEPLLYNDFMYLTEIARKLKKNHSSIRKHLSDFEKKGILNKIIKGRLTMYKINKSFPLIVDYLVIVEKEKLIAKCKSDLLVNEIVSYLHNNLKEDNKALIFGSMVESKKANDADLLITGEIDEKEIEDFGKKFNIKIHLINTPNLSSLKESLRKEIIKKHLIIKGSEDIIKWLI